MSPGHRHYCAACDARWRCAVPRCLLHDAAPCPSHPSEATRRAGFNSIATELVRSARALEVDDEGMIRLVTAAMIGAYDQGVEAGLERALRNVPNA